MPKIDKNQAMIDYFMTCPGIANSALYFNFIDAKNNTKQIITLSNDKNIQTPYIDGSVLKQYKATITDFRSLTPNPIVKLPGYYNENVLDFADVQTLIDWIAEQNNLRNFPIFGDDIEIDSIRTMTDNPNIDSIDTTVSPPLARLSFTVEVVYLDKSALIFN